MEKFVIRAKPSVGKGDFVHIDEDVFPPGFVGICLDNYRNRPIRLCDVYGLYHEAGSVYASQLTKLDVDREGFKKYMAALHESIVELTGSAPDWKPEDLDSNRFVIRGK